MRPEHNKRQSELSWKSMLASRFWRNVDISEPANCWKWTGRTANGYGQIQLEGERYYAHRTSYLLTHGDVPNPQVNHHCDTPLCVNPRHLYSGTQSENMKDKHERKPETSEPLREYREELQNGEGNTNSKLSRDQVREIKQRISNGESVYDMETEYPVSSTTLRDIRENRTWSHVEVGE